MSLARWDPFLNFRISRTKMNRLFRRPLSRASRVEEALTGNRACKSTRGGSLLLSKAGSRIVILSPGLAGLSTISKMPAASIHVLELRLSAPATTCLRRCFVDERSRP